jgi:hypothetical protein
MTDHHEVPVKVNAWVDEGVADLVTALSEIDGLVTLESCQGEPAQRNAFVMFRFGSWRNCGELLFDRLLAAMDGDLRADISLSLVGYDPTNCLGRISLPPEAVRSVATLIRSVRTSACSDGTPCT